MVFGRCNAVWRGHWRVVDGGDTNINIRRLSRASTGYSVGEQGYGAIKVKRWGKGDQVTRAQTNRTFGSADGATHVDHAAAHIQLRDLWRAAFKGICGGTESASNRVKGNGRVFIGGDDVIADVSDLGNVNSDDADRRRGGGGVIGGDGDAGRAIVVWRIDVAGAV